MNKIDVCMPTFNSSGVLKQTLYCLRQAEINSPVEISTIRVTDNRSTDSTAKILKKAGNEYSWELDLEIRDSSLPIARQSLISRVETNWFLFLDDDVRLSENYLNSIVSCVAEGIGAVQGRKNKKVQRKSNEQEFVSDIPVNSTTWVRKRSFRGGTHATLIKKKACKDIEFPRDLVVWEDEYLRRHIEEKGYLWIFNHQALFSHASQERHPPSFTEGYLQAKYDLRPFWHVCLNLPYAALTGKLEFGYVMMIIGHIFASIKYNFNI